MDFSWKLLLILEKSDMITYIKAISKNLKAFGIVHKWCRIEADESQIRYAWNQIFHAHRNTFHLDIRQYACSSKRYAVRKIFAFRFCEVLSEWIFVETRKKAEKCWRISSISDAVSAEIHRLKPYRLWLASASAKIRRNTLCISRIENDKDGISCVLWRMPGCF